MDTLPVASRSEWLYAQARRLRNDSRRAIDRADHVVAAAQTSRRDISAARLLSRDRRAMRLRGGSDAAPSVKVTSVAKLIFAKVVDGRLPSGLPAQTWGGPGRGQACEGCDRHIGASEVEIEVALAGGRTIGLHPLCFRLWLSATDGRGHTAVEL